MTRDEAIKMFAGSTGNNADYAALMVNGFVNLGMLKLDEPKGLDDRINGVLWAFGIGAPETIKRRLDNAGLKIVEKDKP